MGNQSGFLLRQQRREDEAFLSGFYIGVQYAIDTLNISLQETAGWGYERQMRLMETWRENRRYYRAALDARLPEADVYREKLDRSLAGIVRGHMTLIPFAQRYPELREVRYERKK